MNEGVIFRIQKFSIHDGPGIRTTVFLKGCPLNCWWCHNPEGQGASCEIIYLKDKCVNCGSCLKVCQDEAIKSGSTGLEIRKERCSKCHNCLEVCPGNAFELIGKKMSVEELIKLVEKDLIFYDESGGGVTFSGGEPFFQYAFLIECLKACKVKGIHTAVETSGFTSWERIEHASRYIDLFLYDLKLMDEQKHIEYTEVSNKGIHENLVKLSHVHENIRVRIPVITGVNNTEENVIEMCKFLKSTNIKNVSILPFHTIGAYKYEKLKICNKMEGVKPPDMDEIRKISDIFIENGFCAKIGG